MIFLLALVYVVTADPVGHSEPMLRDYGGSKAFMLTDVNTDDRGGAEGILAKRPSYSVSLDERGLTFRFVDPDEQAEAIELGTVKGGSWEFYLAPGEGTPYFCGLVNDDGRPASIVNTLYDSPGHRRIDAKDSRLFRARQQATPAGLVAEVWFAWENWADRIPDAETTWDFEVVRWGRKGSAAWNGLKSIHGRSTWGQLKFSMPPELRLKILRRQLIKAMVAYRAEDSSTKTREGLFEHWRDPEVGDPKFYEACLKPLKAELDRAADEVQRTVCGKAQETSSASAAQTEVLWREILPRWRDLEFTVSRLRTAYLKNQFAGRRP